MMKVLNRGNFNMLFGFFSNLIEKYICYAELTSDNYHHHDIESWSIIPHVKTKTMEINSCGNDIFIF